ncbi:carbohydrate kinase family protein [Halococcus hamelinensis]|uniref:PfkB domain-containing protein n=2 Tax=Halococcus hamelinensis TaxID=332168 RepID=M0LTJ0_9EURY|nr:carbohydrate kinase [Halococcus hamelinensis]EMA36463.1 PfkB domain-containing protein [Halococcus hamelinensis 100A6]
MSTPDVLVAGETLIDFIPDQPGPLSTVESFSRRAGGAPANVAVGLARLDRSPWFLTNVAEDAFGEFLVDGLRGHGIPQRFVTRDPDHQTTLAFVAHDATADREFSFYRTETADQYIDPGVVDDDALDSTSWVALGGVALANEPARSRLFEFVERARDHGCAVVFDPNTRPELWADEATFETVLERMLSLTDVLKTSADDLLGTRFADGGSVDTDSLFEVGPHTVFATRGSAGARAVSSHDAPWGAVDETHPGYAVGAVDTTGAGDAFLAGVLAGLVDDEPLDEVLGFANAVAALTTTDAGASTALPDRAAVAEFRVENE